MSVQKWCFCAFSNPNWSFCAFPILLTSTIVPGKLTKKRKKRLIRATEYEKVIEYRNSSHDDSDDSDVVIVEGSTQSTNKFGEINDCKV